MALMVRMKWSWRELLETPADVVDRISELLKEQSEDPDTVEM